MCTRPEPAAGPAAGRSERRMPESRRVRHHVVRGHRRQRTLRALRLVAPLRVSSIIGRRRAGCTTTANLITLRDSHGAGFVTVTGQILMATHNGDLYGQPGLRLASEHSAAMYPLLSVECSPGKSGTATGCGSRCRRCRRFRIGTGSACGRDRAGGADRGMPDSGGPRGTPAARFRPACGRAYRPPDGGTHRKPTVSGCMSPGCG
jgi:hypothetical protein